MTLDEALDAAADHLDRVITDAVSEFETALRDDGIAANVIAEAREWYLGDLWLWRLWTLDDLRARLLASLPHWTVH